MTEIHIIRGLEVNMEVTKLTLNTDGTAEIMQKVKIKPNDYEVLHRWWFTSDRNIIRAWTIDEYVKCDPHKKIIIPYKIDNREIMVEAHCVEERRIFATKNGKELFGFIKEIDYSVEVNDEQDGNANY